MSERLRHLQEKAKNYCWRGLLFIALSTLLLAGCDQDNPRNQRFQPSPIPEPGSTATHQPSDSSTDSLPDINLMEEGPEPALNH